jgi:RIO kinase 1
MVGLDITSSKKMEKFDEKIDEFRKRIKDSEDFKVKDEVFDTATLMALYKLSSKGYLDALGGTVSTGKEANIFHAVRTQDDKLQELAIKVYRISNSNFKAMQEYLIGDVRFKNVRHTKKDIILAWTIITNRNILVMEFIGEENIPFPQLRNFNLDTEQALFISDAVEDFLVRLYRDAQLVHGDLSEYNILVDPESLTPVFIDMGQAVTLDHLNSDEFLRRDIDNMARFFSRSGVDVDTKDLYEKVIRSGLDHQ